MFPETLAGRCADDRGIGLITAVFVIVVVAMFGTLIARYATLSSVASAEDYHWAQSLFSAQSAAQVGILYRDGGGIGTFSLSTVSGFTTTVADIPGGVRSSASKTLNNSNIERVVEIRFSL